MRPRLIAGAVALLILLVPAAAAAAEDGVLTTSPSSGPPGSTFTVSGDGCTAAPGNFVAYALNGGPRIDQEAIPLGSTDALNAEGTWSGTASMPETTIHGWVAPGTYPVISECWFAGFFSEGSFTVTPYPTLPGGIPTGITAEPSSVAAGSTFSARGPGATMTTGAPVNGYLPFQQVVWVLYPGAIVLGEGAAGQQVSGQVPDVVTSLELPADLAAGSYTLVGFGRPQFSTIGRADSAFSGTLEVVAAGQDGGGDGGGGDGGGGDSDGDGTDGGSDGGGGDADGGGPVEPGGFPSEPPDGDGPLTVSATTVAPGGSLTIAGDGFVPGEEVPIVFYSEPVLLATATADADGAIEASVTIPADASPGVHTIVAFGEEQVLTVQVTVAAEVEAPVRVDAGHEPSGSATPWLPLLVGALGVALLAAGVLRRSVARG
jgi:hypothetical protein